MAMSKATKRQKSLLATINRPLSPLESKVVSGSDFGFIGKTLPRAERRKILEQKRAEEKRHEAECVKAMAGLAGKTIKRVRKMTLKEIKDNYGFSANPKVFIPVIELTDGTLVMGLSNLLADANFGIVQGDKRYAIGVFDDDGLWR